MQYRSLNVQERPVIESWRSPLICIKLTSGNKLQPFVVESMNAAHRRLSSELQIALFVLGYSLLFGQTTSSTSTCTYRSHYPAETHQYPLLVIYAEAKCLSNVTLPQLLAVTFKAAGKPGKGYRGNTKWRKITHSFHKQTFAFLECV